MVMICGVKPIPAEPDSHSPIKTVNHLLHHSHTRKCSHNKETVCKLYISNEYLKLTPQGGMYSHRQNKIIRKRKKAKLNFTF